MELILLICISALLAAADILGLSRYWRNCNVPLCTPSEAMNQDDASEPSAEAEDELSSREATPLQELFQSEEHLPDKRIPGHTGKIVLFTLLFALSVGLAIALELIYDNSLLCNLRLCLMMAMLWPAGIIDAYEMRIPNKLLLAGCVAVFLVSTAECLINPSEMLSETLFRILSSAVVFVVCVLIMLISRGGLGMGDVKLYAVIGLFSGMSGIFTSLFVSLFFSFFAALYLLITKKKQRKDAVPFGPFVLAGTWLALFLTGV